MIWLRVATENDELDRTISKGQYGFWATHIEAIWPDGRALRFDDERDGWLLTDIKQAWTRELIASIAAKERAEFEFYRFLADQIGKPYDMRPLARISCDFDSHEHRKWSCADLIYAALHYAGVIITVPSGLAFLTVRDLMLVVGAITHWHENVGIDPVP